MFDRLESLIGEHALKMIKTKRIFVFGTGGVGGYVVEMLIRSGIEDITICDMDKVDVTNLNRQIIALNSTIGEYKVDVLSKRIHDINPNAKVEAFKKRITVEDISEMHLETYDYVVDAIDDVNVKIALAKYALENDIKLVVSTGTARKLHPEKLKITTLDKTAYDPLARRLRIALKGYKKNKLIVLASDEVPRKIENGVLGSSAFVPSTGGILIASFIINDIISNI